jgi:hypothetical protein
MNLDTVGDAIKEFAQKSAETPEKELRNVAMRVLDVLHRECVEVSKKADGYPANPISADVWLNGAMLGPMAESLADLLDQRGLHDLEEQAHCLRCMAVLSVQSHYHHLVGPAMLARAECNERLGNPDLAVQIYQAVIGDFSWFVEQGESEPDAPSDEDRISLECLAQALDRIVAIQPDSADVAERRALRERCESVLARQ